MFSRKNIALALVLALVVPFPAYAIFDAGGWVLNVPGTHGGIEFMRSLPAFPPEGFDTFWDSEQGICLNAVEEVDQLPARGVVQPETLLQFVGNYTFQKGPVTHPGQQFLAKYFPAMVCLMLYVFWVYCGVDLCPVIIPLPFFFAPVIIFNGSNV